MLKMLSLLGIFECSRLDEIIVIVYVVREDDVNIMIIKVVKIFLINLCVIFYFVLIYDYFMLNFVILYLVLVLVRIEVEIFFVSFV